VKYIVRVIISVFLYFIIVEMPIYIMRIIELLDIVVPYPSSIIEEWILGLFFVLLILCFVFSFVVIIFFIGYGIMWLIENISEFVCIKLGISEPKEEIREETQNPESMYFHEK